MSYADERKAAVIARNNQSRRRSRQMELRIAKLLGGRRVPMSGAGQIKGDCQVITDKIGEIYIECKYSAGLHNKSEPRIRIDFRWFDKMAKDAAIMRSKFAALVFRYHDTRLSDYVIIPVEVFQKYADDPNVDRLDMLAVIDAGEKNGINMEKKMLDVAFAANPRGEGLCMLHCIKGWFVIMDIQLFKEMINDSDVNE